MPGPDSPAPSIALNDEYTMPVLGLGVAELTEDETERAVSTALEVGYRLIDTAAVYGNEAAVGRAIAASGIPRAELFVTTKIANADQGFQASQDAARVSLDRLGLDYIDLFLIHWPMAQLGKYVDTFGGLIQARGDGITRSIGVCNFTEEHVETTIDLTYVTPAVNQIE
ncbi:MAG: 2,5-diketo-D-gluconate reductase [Mycobacterium sp.]|nr:2,5-diketo-D-gluconate reductase [Mycobacterium sp.]